jgi:hypothetical protein
MIFEFVVHRLRWLARVPLAPQIFDALLLTWTAVFERKKLAAMTALEMQILRLPGVRLSVHRFGGTGFIRNGREFGHIHGNGLLDVHLTSEAARELVESGVASVHHVLGASSWISFRVRGKEDVPRAVKLLTLGAEHIRIGAVRCVLEG